MWALIFEQRLELGAGVEEHLYCIVSEALHNVVKHARADGAAVSVTAQADVLRVTVSDDGAGFDPDAEQAAWRKVVGPSTSCQRQIRAEGVAGLGRVGRRRGCRDG